MPSSRTEYLEKALLRAENAYQLAKLARKRHCEVSLKSIARPAEVTLTYTANYIGRHLQVAATLRPGTEILRLDWSEDYDTPIRELKT